jgi:hypothetical protein
MYYDQKLYTILYLGIYSKSNLSLVYPAHVTAWFRVY